VRDFVLENYGASLSADNKEEALEKIYKNLPKMLKDIASVSGQEVKIGISESSFPTKSYNGFSLPKGKYLALKIELGEGKGNNWWCVMYPPLCFEQGAFVSDLKKLKKVLSEDEYKLITEKKGVTLYKFKAVEIWNSIANKF
ncbi:MAG: stage II sporulation protein R, partial [Clostridia bacterium]|nr:stage II sporulation protein R [Clostridia bacterium]